MEHSESEALAPKNIAEAEPYDSYKFGAKATDSERKK